MLAAAPRLLEGDDLVCLLRAELESRLELVEGIHRALTSPYGAVSHRPAPDVYRLQLLIQMADRHIDLSRRLLEEQRQLLEMPPD